MKNLEKIKAILLFTLTIYLFFSCSHVNEYERKGVPVEFDIPYIDILTEKMAYNIIKKLDAFSDMNDLNNLTFNDTIDKCVFDSTQNKYHIIVYYSYSYQYVEWVQPKGRRGYSVTHDAEGITSRHYSTNSKIEAELLIAALRRIRNKKL